MAEHNPWNVFERQNPPGEESEAENPPDDPIISIDQVIVPKEEGQEGLVPGRLLWRAPASAHTEPSPTAPTAVFTGIHSDLVTAAAVEAQRDLASNVRRVNYARELTMYHDMCWDIYELSRPADMIVPYPTDQASVKSSYKDLVSSLESLRLGAVSSLAAFDLLARELGGVDAPLVWQQFFEEEARASKVVQKEEESTKREKDD